MLLIVLGILGFEGFEMVKEREYRIVSQSQEELDAAHSGKFGRAPSNSANEERWGDDHPISTR